MPTTTKPITDNMTACLADAVQNRVSPSGNPSTIRALITRGLITGDGSSVTYAGYAAIGAQMPSADSPVVHTGQDSSGPQEATQPQEWALPSHISDTLGKIGRGVWGTEAREIYRSTPCDTGTDVQWVARLRHELYRAGRTGAGDALSLSYTSRTA